MTQKRWDRLVDAAIGGPVTLGTMFGSKGLRTGTKFFAIWWHGQLVLKLPAARIGELVRAGEGAPFEPMAGRLMNGWLVIVATSDWSVLAEEACVFVQSQQR